MNAPLVRLAILTTLGSLLPLRPAAAQVPPPLKKATHVEITKGPELESATNYLTIMRWKVNNPGGSDVHYGVVRYGTDPKDLKHTAKSPIRLNHGHPYTVFRVRIEGLEPETTYYYRVTSEESSGTSDGVESTVKRLTTPRRGERIVNTPTFE